MVKWAMVLHFYQPPTQDAQITDMVFEQCYVPLMELLGNNPRARVTLNISGSLIEHLRHDSRKPFLNKLNLLVNNGQIELLLSPSTHPLLPLISTRVAGELFEILRKNLAEILPGGTAIGIYPPELGVDDQVLSMINGLGGYCLIDESHVNPEWDSKRIIEPEYTLGEQFLLVSSRVVTEILRSYPTQLRIDPFYNFLESRLKPEQYMVSVNDAELFGHHYKERLSFLEDVFKSNKFELVTCREVVEKGRGKAQKITNVTPSTWQTTTVQIKNGLYWPLWANPQNHLQSMYLALSSMAALLLEPFWEKDEDPGWVIHSARRHFYTGISSCHLYWLSNKPWWHPDLVEAGADELIKCIRSLPVDPKQKSEAEELHKSLLSEMWQYQWSGRVEEQYAEFGREREKLLKSLPELI